MRVLSLAFLAPFFSGIVLLANFIVVMLLVTTVLRAFRRDRPVYSWTGFLVAFILYRLSMGIAVGSVPADLGSLIAFAATEGRELIALSIIASYSLAGTTAAAMPRIVDLARLGCRILSFVAILALPGGPFAGQANLIGLTSSHHVLGLLCVTVVTVALGGSKRPSRVDVLWMVGTLVTLVQTGSRTALLAGLTVVAYEIVRARGSKRSFLAAGALALSLLVAVAVSPRVQATMVDVVSGSLFDSAATGETIVVDGRLQLTLRGAPVRQETANVLKRYAAWGYAIDLFTSSPLVGIGPWRFNDLDLRYSGPEGVLKLATGGVATPVGLSAHNSVLQVAAGSGLLGLLLAGRFVSLAWRRARHLNLGEREVDGRLAQRLLVLGLGTVWASNALLSPAFVVPAGIALMTALAPVGREMSSPADGSAASFDMDL